jgi:diadenosine tetraphosphate (Ap4A) HIT family hydrolase
MMSNCPFCDIESNRIIGSAPGVLALLDHNPCSKGHALVVPRRHIPNYLDLSMDEVTDMHVLARALAAQFQATDPTIKGFNIGLNIGEAAGQTVFHAHLHIIPRRDGDCEDPRGGVRRAMAVHQRRDNRLPGCIYYDHR